MFCNVTHTSAKFLYLYTLYGFPILNYLKYVLLYLVHKFFKLLLFSFCFCTVKLKRIIKTENSKLRNIVSVCSFKCWINNFFFDQI